MFKKSGYLFAFGAISALLCGALPGDVRAEELPPAPTVVLTVKNSSVAFDSVADVPKFYSGDEAKDMAYNIAELEALYRLARSTESFKNQAKPITWDMQAGGCEYLGWLARSYISRQKFEDDSASVHINNSSWLSYSSNPSKMSYRMLYKGDCNGDGKTEQIYLCPNSGLEVRCGKRIIGSIYPLGSFQAMTVPASLGSRVSLPSNNFISYTSVNSIGDVCLNGNKLSIEVILERRESCYGIYAVRKLEKRTYEIVTAKDGSTPFINIVEPLGDKVADCRQVPLSGKIDTPAGLLNAVITVNGEQMWSSPSGLNSKDLDFDLCVDLKRGDNSVVFDVADLEGRKVKRSVNLHTAPPDKVNQTRVLIIGSEGSSSGQDNKIKALKVRQNFIERGYSVKTLCGAEATAENISKALDFIAKNCTASDQVMLYLVGPAKSNAGSSYLVTMDQEESTAKFKASDIENFRRRLPHVRFMVVWDLYNAGIKDEDTEFNFPRELNGRYCAGLFSSPMSRKINTESGKNLTDVFLESLDKCSGDLFEAVKYAYPVLCSDEISKARKEKRGLSLPILLTY